MQSSARYERQHSGLYLPGPDKADHLASLSLLFGTCQPCTRTSGCREGFAQVTSLFVTPLLGPSPSSQSQSGTYIPAASSKLRELRVRPPVSCHLVTLPPVIDPFATRNATGTSHAASCALVLPLTKPSVPGVPLCLDLGFQCHCTTRSPHPCSTPL